MSLEKAQPPWSYNESRSKSSAPSKYEHKYWVTSCLLLCMHEVSISLLMTRVSSHTQHMEQSCALKFLHVHTVELCIVSCF